MGLRWLAELEQRLQKAKGDGSAVLKPWLIQLEPGACLRLLQMSTGLGH